MSDEATTHTGQVLIMFGINNWQDIFATGSSLANGSGPTYA